MRWNSLGVGKASDLEVLTEQVLEPRDVDERARPLVLLDADHGGPGTLYETSAETCSIIAECDNDGSRRRFAQNFNS